MKTRNFTQQLKWKAWITCFVFLVSGYQLSAQSCGFYSDSYNSTSGWTTDGITVSISSNAFNFTNTTTCNGNPLCAPERMYKTLPGTLDNSWSADIDFSPSATSSVGPGHYLIGLTAGNAAPRMNSTIANQDGIFLFVTSPEGPQPAIPPNPPLPSNSTGWLIKARGKNGTGNLTRTNGIPICNIQSCLTNDGAYFLRLERLNENTGRASVFLDSERTVHAPGSPQCFTLTSDVTGLNTIQHFASYSGATNRSLTATLDNLCITDEADLSFDFGSIQGDDLFCLEGPLQRFAVNYIPGAEYVWTVPSGMSISQGQGSNAISLDPGPIVSSGTLSVSITFPTLHPCLDPIVIDTSIASEECCFASNDLFEVWDNSASLATQSFSGKYYLKDNVTLYASIDTEIDMTNVDIVFGKCATIIFEGNSTLRANNSVFRTCDDGDSWTGFQFRDNSKAIVNECTFKNAVKALSFESEEGSNSDARITNNLFSNNQIGIWAENTTFSESIMGNTFMIDDTEVDYTPAEGLCENTMDEDEAHGVYFSNVDFLGVVSQNDFINATDSNYYKLFWGVRAFASNGGVSKNNFTNMYRSVEFSESSHAYIENNEIEITRNFDLPDHQIVVTSNSTNVGVSGNILRNSNEYYEVPITNSAIYAEDVEFINIQDNEVYGFVTGIQATDLTGAHIGDNQIWNSNFYGIYVENGSDIKVSCNQINMNYINSAIGIAYILNIEGGSDIVIKSNCIMECESAMYLQSAVGACNISLPQIKNNYMYNYRSYGINILNFVGSIGSGAGWANAGKNTFVSNNDPAIGGDISSSCPININGNYGIFTLNGPITQGNQNAFHSTASCGHQIDLNSSIEFGTDENCDIYLEGSEVFSKLKPGSYRLEPEFIGHFENLNEEERRGQLASHLEFLSKESPDLVDPFYQQVVQSNLLGKEEQKWFTFYKYLSEDDYMTADLLLNGITALSDVDKDLIYIEGTLLKIMTGKESVRSIKQSRISRLNNIATGVGSNADRAGVIITLMNKSGDYNFKHVKLPQEPDAKLNKLLLHDDFLDLFPNPAQDELFIKYNASEAESLEMNIYDMRGVVMTKDILNVTAQQKRLDISSFVPGIYLIELRSASGNVQRGKFVKE